MQVMPSRGARIKMYIAQGMTPEAAVRAVLQAEADAKKASEEFGRLLSQRGIQPDQVWNGNAAYRFNPLDDNDPVNKAMADAIGSVIKIGKRR